MFKKFLTIWVIAVVMVGLLGLPAFAGVNKKPAKMRVLTPQLEQQWFETLAERANRTKPDPSQFYFLEQDTTDTLGGTFYDYATNSVTGRMLDHSANGIHFGFMKIDPADPNATRFVTYDFADWTGGVYGGFFGNQSFTETRRTGWGRVVNGQNDEVLSVMHGGGVNLFQDAGEAFYAFTEFPVCGGLFPGLARNGSQVAVIADCNADFAPDSLFISNDLYSGGPTWSGNPLADFVEPGAALYDNVETWPSYNPLNGDLAYTFCEGGPISGNIGYAVTSDGGATWNAQLIYDEDTILLPDSIVYFVQNFSQFNADYGPDGTYHVVFNGYGARVTQDSLIDYFIYPIVYWNSANQQLVELTDPAIARNPALSDALADMRPGNGIGAAYPSLSFGPDGIIAVIWQQAELATPDSLQPANDTSAFFATDIYCAVSMDNGATWSQPVKIAGEPKQSDVFPNAAPQLIQDGNGDLWLDFIYLWDPDAGVSLFGQGGTSVAYWVYKRVKVQKPTGIEDPNDGVATTFKLEQNYPNPFNPSTTISFELSQREKVRLEVYNALGERVATLVDGFVNAGSHDITFDASNLASGIYFYKLTAGNFTDVKKMVLMK